MIGAPPGGFGKKHTPGGLFLSFNIQKAHRRAGCRHLFTIDKQCFYFVTYMIGIKIWLDQLQNRSIRLFEKTWCSVEVEVVVIVVVVVVVVGCSCLIASKLSECLVEFVTDGLVFLLLSQKFIRLITLKFPVVPGSSCPSRRALICSSSSRPGVPLPIYQPPSGA